MAEQNPSGRVNDPDPIDYMDAQMMQPGVRTHTRKSDAVVAMEARIAELEAALREMIGGCFWCNGCGAIWRDEPVPCPRCTAARSVIGK